VDLPGADPDGDAVSFRILESPIGGSVTGEGARYRFDPLSSFIGETSFRYVVSDGIAESAPATVTVRVGKAPASVSHIEPVGQGAMTDLWFTLRGPAGTIPADDAIGVTASWQDVAGEVRAESPRYAFPIDVGTALRPGEYPLIVHFPGDVFHEAGDLRAMVRVEANEPPRLRGLFAPAGAEVGRDTRIDLVAADAEEGVVRYELDVDGDGDWDLTREIAPAPAIGEGTRNTAFVHRFDEAGEVRVRARVTDRMGAVDEREVDLRVDELGPDGAHAAIDGGSGGALALVHHGAEQAAVAVADGGRYVLTSRSRTYGPDGWTLTAVVTDTGDGSSRTYSSVTTEPGDAVTLSPTAPLATLGSVLVDLETGATTDLGDFRLDLRGAGIDDAGTTGILWESIGGGVAFLHLDTGERRTLSLPGSQRPLLSGDGTVAVRPGDERGTLAVSDVNGGSRTIEVRDARIRPLDVSRDGRIVLVRSLGEVGEVDPTEFDVFRVDTVSGEVTAVEDLLPSNAGDLWASQAALSGDGRTAVIWGRVGGSGVAGLHRLDMTTADLERIDLTRDGRPGSVLAAGAGFCEEEHGYCDDALRFPAEPILDVSHDGRSVMYASYLNDLVPGDVHHRIQDLGYTSGHAPDGGDRELNYAEWTMAAPGPGPGPGPGPEPEPQPAPEPQPGDGSEPGVTPVLPPTPAGGAAPGGASAARGEELATTGAHAQTTLVMAALLLISVGWTLRRTRRHRDAVPGSVDG
jgi:hypothetical protein